MTMKQFITNILIFCMLFFIINLLPNIFLDPYYGNDLYSMKYQYFINHKKNFNTIIFGSSRLYRHINPAVLDDLLSDYHTSTFNLAAPAIFNPEIYFLFEKLIETIKSNSLKYAIVELQPLLDIERKNLNTIRNFYWLNLDYLNFAVRYAFDSDYSILRKCELSGKYLLSYFCKIVNYIYGYKRLALEKLNTKQSLLMGINNDGFYSLDDQMEDIGGNNGYRQRLMRFINDTSVLYERLNIANKAFTNRQNNRFVNDVHLEKLLDLIEKSKRKGIHLILIIPPRLNDYNELLAIRDKIPEQHFIELANPEKFPGLYRVNFSFDHGHLNKRGADALTNYFAEQLIDIISR